jgi:MFS family permease
MELVWVVAGGVGPVLGGLFAERLSWRWNFWINLPISGTTFILLFIYLDVHNPKTPVLDGLKAIDWFGSLSIIALVLMLLLGLEFGGATVPWNSPRVICLIVFGSLMSIAFIYSEKRLARYPLMPLKLFANRSNAASLLVTLWHSMVRFSSSVTTEEALTTTDIHRCRILPPTLLSVRQRVFTIDLWSPRNAHHHDRSHNRNSRGRHNSQHWSLS